MKRNDIYEVIKNPLEDKFSRYINDKIYRSTLEEFLETYEIKELPIKDFDKYVLIGSAWENRLDLVADYFYNNGDLWWVLAMANDIINPSLLPVETRLRIPGLTTLWGYKGVMLK